MKLIFIISLIVALTLADSFNLYSTGIDGDFNGFDDHYTVIAYPLSYNGPAFIGTSYPSDWLPDDANSKWIGASSALDSGFPQGSYVYYTTFDLSGYDPTTASLTGLAAADDEYYIFLNGVDTGLSCTDPFQTYVCHDFQKIPVSISSGFINGVNVLEFRVPNTPSNPTPAGFNFEVTGTSAQLATPQEICDNADQADWAFGQGYYCSSPSTFVQCYGVAPNIISSEQNCPAGTTCACSTFGQECSNFGTLTPCRS